MYINEHVLTLKLILCKNQGNEDLSTNRSQFDKDVLTLDQMSQGKSKKIKDIQVLFKKLRLEAEKLKPIETDYSDLYEMILEISKRLVNKYARGKNFNSCEIANITYLRVIKYIKTFDINKISKTTGVRVNTFAYMTQIVKNVIFAEISRQDKELNLVNAIKDNYNLMSDLDNQNLDTESSYLVESNYGSIEESIYSKNVLETIFKLKKHARSISEIVVKSKVIFDYEISDVLDIIIRYNLIPLLEDQINKNRWEF